MKFCLVSASPNENLEEREKNKSIAAFPPLGLLYLAIVLKENGFEALVLDQPGQGLTMDETVKWVLHENPDVLGFSTLASSGITAAIISNKVKKINPNIKVVFGNHYATFNSERILQKYPSVDIIIRGEGEKTIVELAECLQKNGDFANVRGITFRKSQNIITTPDQALIKNLDDLPFPNRNLINAEYHCLIGGANVAPKKFTSIITSRGCSYRCRFCNCAKLARNNWRARSAENTIEELSQLSSQGYKQLIFVDDHFTLNPKRTIEICKGIRKEKLDLEWICEGRVDNCSHELFIEMKKAGLKILYFGIENANQRILNYYNKTITPQKSENAVRTARKAGIDTIIGSFIMGSPDETREEIQNTIDFAKRIPIDLPQFSLLLANPGNEIWSELAAKGVLNVEKYWETGVTVSDVCPTAVPANEIKKMMHNAFFEHVRRPSFLAKELARSIISSYRRNVFLNNLKRISIIKDELSKAV